MGQDLTKGTLWQEKSKLGYLQEVEDQTVANIS